MSYIDAIKEIAAFRSFLSGTALHCVMFAFYVLVAFLPLILHHLPQLLILPFFQGAFVIPSSSQFTHFSCIGHYSFLPPVSPPELSPARPPSPRFCFMFHLGNYYSAMSCSPIKLSLHKGIAL